MKNSLAEVCKALRLAHVYEIIPFDDRESFLLGVLRMEIERREDTKLKRLLKKVAFTQLKTLEDYDFSAVTLTEHCTKEVLRDLRFLERKENVLMLGKVGTGKTHLATALDVEACRQGYTSVFSVCRIS